jgi:hypothetical protein
MAQESNVCETGVESIRINGQRVEALPFVQQHYANEGLKLANDEHRKKRIKELLARYPAYDVGQMRMQIGQARMSIDRSQLVIEQMNNLIAEYTAFIALCEQRDKELVSLGVKLVR